MEEVRTIQPETDLAARLAMNMRDMREAAKLTVKEAARRAGMHWSFWMKLEKEKGRVRSYMLRRIADALRVEPAALIEVPPKMRAMLQGYDAPAMRPRRAHVHPVKRRSPSRSLRPMRPFKRTLLATRRALPRRLLMWALALAFHRCILMAAKMKRDLH